MCYIDGQKNKYSVLNECSRMLKYNISQDIFMKSEKKNVYQNLWINYTLIIRL
jgi:hypothetical protein